MARVQRVHHLVALGSPTVELDDEIVGAFMPGDEVMQPRPPILVQTAYAVGAGHGQGSAPWPRPPIEEWRMPVVAQDDELGDRVGIAQGCEGRHRREEVADPGRGQHTDAAHVLEGSGT